MERAILVAGDEKRFIESLEKVRDYLNVETCVTDIEFIHAAQFSPQRLRDVLGMALQKPSDSPILLVYSGHGVLGAWEYGYSQRLKYRDLVPLAHGVKAPLFFINDCCHAYSIVDELKQYGWKFPFGLIAAAPAEESTFMCIDEVLQSWKNKKLYDTRDHPPYYVITLSDLSFDWKEVIVGGWQALWRHRVSKILHWVAPNRFKITQLRVHVVFSRYGSTPEEVEAEKVPHYNERPRWGEVLDHYFFPRQLHLEF